MLLCAVQLPQQLWHLQYSATTGVRGVRARCILYLPLGLLQAVHILPIWRGSGAPVNPLCAPSKMDWTPTRSTLSRSLHRAFRNSTINRPGAMMQCKMHMKMCSLAMRRRGLMATQQVLLVALAPLSARIPHCLVVD